MKIVRLIEEFPAEINRGLAPNVYYISREQVKQGHQVWIFAFTKEKPGKELKDGITICRIPRPNKIRWNGGLAFTEAIKKEKINPDIIHGLNCIPFGWFISKMRKVIAAKYVMSLHTPIFPFRHNYIKGFKNILRNIEFSNLCRFLAKRVDLVLPITNYIKNELIEANTDEDKIEVIPPGIDLDKFPPKDITTKKIISDKINLLYVGRFAQMKGLKYLISACQIIKNKGITFHLDMIGGKKDDDDFYQTTNLIKKLRLTNNISIIPPVSQSKLIHYYNKSDVLVLPSLFEPFGKVILEAQTLGLPVISTNSGGPRDMIKNNYNGLLIPPQDSQSLAKYIEILANNEVLRSQISANARKNAVKYDWKIIADKYSNIFYK